MRPRLARSSLIDGHASGVLSNSPASASIPRMSNTQIDFGAPAASKMAVSNKERVLSPRAARPYMYIEETLDGCNRQFMQLPEAQGHLYEIHTAPQSDVVGAICRRNTLSSWRA